MQREDNLDGGKRGITPAKIQQHSNGNLKIYGQMKRQSQTDINQQLI